MLQNKVLQVFVLYCGLVVFKVYTQTTSQTERVRKNINSVSQSILQAERLIGRPNGTLGISKNDLDDMNKKADNYLKNNNSQTAKELKEIFERLSKFIVEQSYNIIVPGLYVNRTKNPDNDKVLKELNEFANEVYFGFDEFNTTYEQSKPIREAEEKQMEEAEKRRIEEEKQKEAERKKQEAEEAEKQKKEAEIKKLEDELRKIQEEKDKRKKEEEKKQRELEKKQKEPKTERPKTSPPPQFDAKKFIKKKIVSALDVIKGLKSAKFDFLRKKVNSLII